jgi:hypothetical protein
VPADREFLVYSWKSLLLIPYVSHTLGTLFTKPRAVVNPKKASNRRLVGTMATTRIRARTDIFSWKSRPLVDSGERTTLAWTPGLIKRVHDLEAPLLISVVLSVESSLRDEAASGPSSWGLKPPLLPSLREEGLIGLQKNPALRPTTSSA